MGWGIAFFYLTFKEEEKDDTTPIFPIANAFDHDNVLRKLITSFDSAYETLNHINKTENFLQVSY
jgi:hypothetical protein